MRERLTRTLLNFAMAFRALFDHPGRSFLTLLATGVFQVQREPSFSSSYADPRAIARRKPFTTDDLAELRRRLNLTRAVGGEMWIGLKRVSHRGAQNRARVSARRRNSVLPRSERDGARSRPLSDRR